jgi:hypothetical protein
MPTNPVLHYTFNEDSATTIRDYSDGGGFDGTGTNLTIQNSARVGKEALFNASTDQIDAGTTDHLIGQADMALHLGIKITGSAGSRNILDKASQLEVVYNNGTNQIEASLYVASGTAFVKGNVAVDTYYDIDIVYVSNVLTLYIDGSSVAADATKSGVIDASASRMYIGDDGSLGGELMAINEVKLYEDTISTTIIDAVIAEQNGISSDTNNQHGFAVGDIIGADTDGTAVYAVVTFASGTEFRFHPISSNIRAGQKFTRLANLWDTDRQWAFKIDDTPEICFYDGQSQSSEILTAAKKTYCLNQNGLFEVKQEISSNTTAVDNDTYFICDLSGGSFTLTLPASPVTGKVYKIKDNGSATGGKRLTIDGNGNNIDGNATIQIKSKYTYYPLYFDGTEWFII